MKRREEENSWMEQAGASSLLCSVSPGDCAVTCGKWKAGLRYFAFSIIAIIYPHSRVAVVQGVSSHCSRQQKRHIFGVVDFILKCLTRTKGCSRTVVLYITNHFYTGVL